MGKKKVIVVTDGDDSACEAVSTATEKIGGECVLASAGNPTWLTGEEIVGLIKKTEKEPVVVMVDDKGHKGVGKGEAAMDTILHDQSIDVLGIVAVSSNGKDINGTNVISSVDKYGEVVDCAVDKHGNDMKGKNISGDTLSILKYINDIPIIGMGDPGKMDFNDDVSKGSPITTRALEEILRINGQYGDSE